MVANTTWAFATVNHRNEELISALTMAAERRLSEFNPQSVANTAWVFATAHCQDERLLATLAIVAKRRLSEFNP